MQIAKPAIFLHPFCRISFSKDEIFPRVSTRLYFTHVFLRFGFLYTFLTSDCRDRQNQEASRAFTRAWERSKKARKRGLQYRRVNSMKNNLSLQCNLLQSGCRDITRLAIFIYWKHTYFPSRLSKQNELLYFTHFKRSIATKLVQSTAVPPSHLFIDVYIHLHSSMLPLPFLCSFVGPTIYFSPGSVVFGFSIQFFTLTFSHVLLMFSIIDFIFASVHLFYEFGPVLLFFRSLFSKVNVVNQPAIYFCSFLLFIVRQLRGVFCTEEEEGLLVFMNIAGTSKDLYNTMHQSRHCFCVSSLS